MIGKTISHYKIIEKIGSGGMGVVYKAEDSKLDRTVALKFLPSHLNLDEDSEQRFISEAKAASTFDHPNICTIYEIDKTDDDQLFIAMAYYEGETLKKKLENGPTKVDEAVDIASQVAEGLSLAHKKGIVHRDIKPANIFITNDNIIKILDFGLAKVSSQAQITKTGTTMGTIAYMSPEQVKGEKVDYLSDIWSLGVIIYEMLTGTIPFKGEYEAAIIYELLNTEPDAIHQYRTDVPDNLLLLLQKLLKKDTKSRISSIDSVIEELKQKQSSLSENTDVKSIAVLYFDNMSPDKENEYFCAGITEDIIIDLSKIQELKVIPRSDVFPFRKKEVNSRKIGEILGVKHILVGSVRKAGQQIRVTAQLIDIQTGFQIWAERYDRLLEDIFELQAEVSQQIANALKISLSDSERESLAQKPTDDLRAYDFYMRGSNLLTAGGKKNNECAIKMFEHALSIDQNYSLAYVALAEAYNFQYMFYDGNQKWLGKIISAIEKALELDPNLNEVEIAKGMVFYHQKRFSDAKRIFKNFLKRKEDNYQAHYWLGVIGEITNDYDGAIIHFNRAAQLKPYSEEPWLHLYLTSKRKGDIKSARFYGDKMLKQIERKLNVNVKDAIALSRSASYKAFLEDKISASSAIKKVLEIAPNDGLALYNCACTYAVLGNKEEAFELLQKAIRIGYKNIIEWIENDPDFEAFRDDPHFKDILTKAGEQ